MFRPKKRMECSLLSVVLFRVRVLIVSQQTHHVETTLCECGILVTLFSAWYQRGNHVIACLVYDLYNNMAK